MTHVTLTGRASLATEKGRFEPPPGKRAALLYYLAFQGDWVRRDELLHLLYPDRDDEAARANLRPLLSRIRGLPYTEELDADATRLRWRVSSDVGAFRKALAQGRPERALAHYHGALLASFHVDRLPAFTAWLDMERQALRRAWRLAVTTVAEALSGAGRHGDAADLLGRLLQDDPLDEDAARRQLAALGRAGRRLDALNTYDTLKADLAREVEVAPEEATTELVRRIRTDPGTTEVPPHRAVSPGASARLRLPGTTTKLVGREREIDEISRILGDADSRLLSVVGPGGIGKTRVAIELITRLAPTFRDGAVFVQMTAVADGDGMVSALAEALGLTFLGPLSMEDQLLEHLRPLRMLLVVDNLEHLLGHAHLLAGMLASAPELTILATSQERLRLHGEWVYPLQGLSLPGPDEGASGPSEALELLLRAGRRARSTFRLEEDAAAAARICRRVGGTPLAIELAASWLRVLGVAEVADELDRGLDLLQSPSRDGPERHQSMRVVLEQSWTLLSVEDRHVLQGLSVIRGGFRREAAAEVTSASLPRLAALVDGSLLTSDGAGRYDLHPLMQQFLEEMARRRPQAAAEAHERHACYYLGMIASFEGAFPHGDTSRSANEVETELANILTAWTWAADHGRGDLLEPAVHPLGWYFSLRGRHQQGLAWIEQPIRSDPDGLLAMRQRMWQAGFLNDLFQPAAALQRLDRAVHLADRLAARADLACALRVRGIARLRHDPPDEALAEASFRQALALYRELGDVEGVAMMLNNLAYRVSRPSESIAALQEAHELARDAGETHALAMISGSLALLLLYCSGSYAASHAAAEESVAGHRATGFTWKEANTSLILAEASLALGNATAAETVAHRALDLGSQFQGGAAAAIRGGAHAILGHAARLRGERAAHEQFRTALRMLRVDARDETAAWARVMSLDGLARIAWTQGRTAAMRERADEALAHLQAFEPGGSYFMPAALRLTCRVRLGEAFVLDGEHARAERHLHETLSLAREWGRTPAVLEALLALGELRGYQGRDAEAGDILRVVAGHEASAFEMATRATDALQRVPASASGAGGSAMPLEELLSAVTRSVPGERSRLDLGPRVHPGLPPMPPKSNDRSTYRSSFWSSFQSHS